MIGRGPPERPASHRLFIAVPLPPPLRARVATLVEDVRAEAEAPDRGPGAERRGAVRWVAPEGVHLTLKFLGSTDPSVVPAVRTAVTEAAATGAPTRLVLRGVGGFPSSSRPRVLWLGLADGHDAMARLAADLDVRLRPHGWEPEHRAFHAHLTLARCEDPAAGSRALEALTRLAADLELGWTADRLVLYRSHLGRGPARYEPLLEAPLGG